MYRFPERERGHPFPWLALLLAVAAFALPAVLVALGPLPALARFDLALSNAIRDLPPAALDDVALAATLFGDFPLTTTLMVALSALLLAFGRRALALHAAWLFVLTKLAVAATKHTLARSRPIALYEGSDSYSFPSGHATSGAVLLGVVAVLFLARRRADGPAGAGGSTVAILVPTVAAALLVALSRVRLGAHWPSDVVAGLALATALVLPFAWHARREPAPPRALPWLALGLLVAGYAVHATLAWHDEKARYTDAAAPVAAPVEVAPPDGPPNGSPDGASAVQDTSPQSSDRRLSRPQVVR